MPPRSVAGFTLIELMVTIAIASILLALALPLFTRFGLAAARTKILTYQLPFLAALETILRARR